MTIYLVKGYLDVAATSLADAQSLYTALLDLSDSDNVATLNRVTAKLETLVQSDSAEPVVISSIDDAAGTVSSWVTDASVTLAVGLGDADPNNSFAYASSLSWPIVGSTRSGTLALNTTNLRAALSGSPTYRGRLGAAGARTFCLQVRTSAGETKALLDLLVRPGVLASSPTDLDATSYLTTAAARASLVLNLSGVTSITGGGATALDGQDAGSTTFPVGCVAVTSDSNIGRSWRLLGTYLAATDLTLGKVKPTNSDATLNAVHWQLI